MNIKQLIAIAGIMLVCMCTACSSKEDELEGSWTTTFGLANDYVQYRVFTKSDNNPTYFHTFTFKKGENGNKGTFVDGIAPLSFGGSNSDDIKVGSKISGTWEVKNNKIHLYYNDDISLTNADNLGEDDRNQLEEEMSRYFLSDYKKAGENGVSYEIIEKNDKKGLELKFDKGSITLTKSEKKE